MIGDELSPFVFALVCSLFAALGTAVGGTAIFFARDADKVFLANCSGFAAGVMLFLSMFDLIPEAMDVLGLRASVFLFMSGWGVFAVVQRAVHAAAPNATDGSSLSAMSAAPAALFGFFGASSKDQKAVSRRQLASALTTFSVLFLHNLPEGLVVLLSNASSSSRLELGVPVTLGIAMHNLAEGAACAVSVYIACRSRSRAFVLAAVSGLAEPLAVVLGHVLLSAVVTPRVVAGALAMVAGIMSSLVLSEMIPEAQQSPDTSHWWIMAGLGFAAIPVVLLPPAAA